MTEAHNDKYLGLPSKVGMDKTNCFKYLIDHVMQRVNGCIKRQLSLGGKEILLKSVALPIPSDSMLVFKILKQVCKGYLNQCRTIGGRTMTTESECIRWHGGNCVFQKTKVEWVSVIYTALTWRY